MVHKIHKLLFPHPDNNHRATAFDPRFIAFYLIVFLLLESTFGVIGNVRPGILGYATNISVNDLLSQTNQKRQENNLPILTLNSTLSAAAKEKGEDMISKGYWAHNSPDGKTPWFWISKSGYNYFYAGENLARDFNDSASVVDAWIASPSHRDNLLNNKYQDIGLAVINGKFQGYETTIIVQMFGAKRTTAAKVIDNGATTNNSQPLAEKQKDSITPIPTTAGIGKEVEITPSVVSSQIPTTAVIGKEVEITPSVVSSQTKAVTKEPMFNVFLLTKNIAVALSLLLLVVLILDAIVMYRKKIVRLAGHNFAHATYLFALIAVLFLTAQGQIL